MEFKNIKQLKKEIEELTSNHENKEFIFLKKDGVKYVSNDTHDMLIGQAKLQQLQEVCEEIQMAFNKCNSCWLNIIKEKSRENNTPRDWSQRIDELVLLYSSINGLNYNEAKEELLKKFKGERENE